MSIKVCLNILRDFNYSGISTNINNIFLDFEEPEITNEEVIEPKWKAGDNPR